MSEFTRNTDKDDDEIVIVELPKSSIRILKEVVRREEAYNWFHNKIKNWWIITVAGLIILTLTLLEKIQDIVQAGGIK